MEDLFVDFTTSILHLNKLVQRIKSYEMEKFGLKPVHVMCCYYLNKYPKQLTAKDICELSLEDKGAISRALRTMQERGLVKYDANGRNSVVELTDEGKAFADVICERADSAVKAGSADFTDEERKFFYKSLGDIVVNLKKYYAELIGS